MPKIIIPQHPQNSIPIWINGREVANLKVGEEVEVTDAVIGVLNGSSVAFELIDADGGPGGGVAPGSSSNVGAKAGKAAAAKGGK
mgnify:CR=1 FL=1